jgi:hypothetical protein
LELLFKGTSLHKMDMLIISTTDSIQKLGAFLLTSRSNKRTTDLLLKSKTTKSRSWKRILIRKYLILSAKSWMSETKKLKFKDTGRIILLMTTTRIIITEVVTMGVECITTVA